MIKTILIVLLLLVATISPARAQLTLSGTVADESTGRMVPFAGIGIAEKGVGTVCNAYGAFTLAVPAGMEKAVVTIAHTGYQTQTVPISSLKPGVTLFLTPAVFKMPEVSVHATRPMVIGYRPGPGAAKGFFRPAGLGGEAGALIRNSTPARLSAFHLNILQAGADSVTFRMNLYAVKKGKPGEHLNQHDLTFTISAKDTGIYTLPLAGEDIRVSGDFICSVELIALHGRPAADSTFLFSALADGDGVLYKKVVSMGRWERIRKYSFCFWFTGSS